MQIKAEHYHAEIIKALFSISIIKMLLHFLSKRFSMRFIWSFVFKIKYRMLQLQFFSSRRKNSSNYIKIFSIKILHGKTDLN